MFSLTLYCSTRRVWRWLVWISGTRSDPFQPLVQNFGMALSAPLSVSNGIGGQNIPTFQIRVDVSRISRSFKHKRDERSDDLCPERVIAVVVSLTDL